MRMKGAPNFTYRRMRMVMRLYLKPFFGAFKKGNVSLIDACAHMRGVRQSHSLFSMDCMYGVWRPLLYEWLIRGELTQDCFHHSPGRVFNVL